MASVRACAASPVAQPPSSLAPQCLLPLSSPSCPSLTLPLSRRSQEYRLLHATAARYVANRLIYPRNLALLPLLALATTKNGALRGSRKDVAPDERISMGFDVMSLNSDHLTRLCYPGLYLVSDPAGNWGSVGQDGEVILPQRLPLTLEKLDLKGAYLLDTGRIFVLLLGRALAPEFIKQVRRVGRALGQRCWQETRMCTASEATESIFRGVIAQSSSTGAVTSTVFVCHEPSPLNTPHARRRRARDAPRGHENRTGHGQNDKLRFQGISRQTRPRVLLQVFGLPQQATQQELQAAKVEPARDSPLSQRLNNVLGQLRKGNPAHPLCFIVKQGDPQVCENAHERLVAGPASG